MAVIAGDTYAERAIAGTLGSRGETSNPLGRDLYPRFNGGTMLLMGHSLPTVGGVRGRQASYSRTLASRLGITNVQDLTAGGAISCWPDWTINSNAGWGWLFASSMHGAAPGMNTFGEPYLPVRHIALLHTTQNDLGELGSNKPKPMQNALKSMIAWLNAAAYADSANSAISYSGTWSTTALGGFGFGTGGTYKSTTTVNDYVEVVIPSDFPGTPQAVTCFLMLDPTKDATIGYKVDGVDQADIRLTGSVECDTEVVGKINTYPIRLKNLAAGTHTIRFTLKTQHIAGSQLYFHGASIGAHPDDGPIIVVPSCIKTAGSDYSLWNGTPHGPDAGTNPMNNASVEAWKVAEKAVVDDFGSNVVYVDIDTPLAQNAKNFVADKTHFDGQGVTIVHDTIYKKLVEINAITTRRIEAPSIPPTSQYSRVFNGRGGETLSNSWVPSAGTTTPLSLYRSLDGRVYMQGAVTSGSSATATISTLSPDLRPLRDLDFLGFSSTGAIQRWRITAAGVLSIISGGDTTRSTVHPVSWTPSLA